MANNRDEFLKAGNDILDSVSKAIESNDYSHLAADINRAVKAVSYAQRTTYSSSRRAATVNVNNPRPAQKKVVFPFLQKKVSRYLGVPEMFFGGGFGAFLALLLLGAIFSGSLVGSIVVGIMTALCVAAFFKGLNKYRLANKYYQYGNVLKEAQYFSISDLAKVLLKSDSEVLKDIKGMMKLGFLPRAKLDKAETTCMITDEAYQMYLGAETDRIAREHRQQAQDNAQKAAAHKAKADQYAEYPEKVRDILIEGDEYVSYVKWANDVIPDTEEMSNKLYRLEEIMNRIFAQVKKDPSSAEELHKLMNYYLPTTKKLLGAYVELDKQPEVGDNITKTKQEIDGALDTINEAFENLLDSLFQDMAWDISSDISVMKTMMAQDGLTEEGQGFAAAMQTQPK